MQRAIFVRFETALPQWASIGDTLARLLGTAVSARVGGVALDDTGEFVAMTLDADGSRVIVEVDQLPTHAQWAAVAALEELGGLASRSPPAFAKKKLTDVAWVERSKLLRWIRGRD